MSKEETSNVIDSIIDFELGCLSDTQTLILFAELVKTGMAWQLQGSYGRTASSLIKGGLITNEGKVNWDIYNELADDYI
jgi:hypothetical protein